MKMIYIIYNEKNKKYEIGNIWDVDKNDFIQSSYKDEDYNEAKNELDYLNHVEEKRTSTCKKNLITIKQFRQAEDNYISSTLERTGYQIKKLKAKYVQKFVKMMNTYHLRYYDSVDNHYVVNEDGVKLYQYNEMIGELSMLSRGGLLNIVDIFLEDLEKNTDYYNENNH
jgi:DNA integrity scanning protein DisA with diadenylate cyclase activity